MKRNEESYEFFKYSSFCILFCSSFIGKVGEWCGDIQEQKRLSGWKEEDFTIAFLELRRCEIVGLRHSQCIDDRVKSEKKQQQADGGGCEYAPAALSGGFIDRQN